jgi:hypothetical protein
MAFITPGQVSNIPKKPLTLPTAWTRPADWVAITDNANKIQFLVSDIGTQSTADTGYATSYSINTVFTRTGGTYSIYIDWGDGSGVTQVSTTTTTNTNHSYTTGGTPCSRGYNTWVITITADPTVSLTTCNLVAPVLPSTPLYLPSGLLEIYYGDTIGAAVGLINKYGNGNTITGNYPNLEYAKLPSVWTGTSLAYTFYGCTNLQKVILPVTMNSCTSIAFCFQNCSSLQTITFPSSMTACTTLGNTFASCASLYQVTFPSNLTLNSVTDMANTFLDCSSLDNVTIPSATLCTSYSGTFGRCSALTNVKFTAIFSSLGTITWTNAFLSCASLVRADIPTTGSINTTWSSGNMFSGCGSLAYFSFPATISFSSLSATFNGCDNLVRVDMPTTMNGTFTMASCFSSCSNLSYMTLPTGGSPSVTSLNSTFSGCSAITSVVFPGNWALSGVTDMNSTFLNCNSIKTITFPSTAANSVNTMNLCFQNCYILTSLTLPTSLNAVTTLNGAFQNCYNLATITLPSSMAALTGTGLQNTFNGCKELVNLTLPTTVNTNGIGNMTSCFNGCNSLTSITLPVLGTSVNNLTTAFSDTWALRTLNFNTGVMSGGVDLTNMLLRSNVNTLLNTASIGGSTASQAAVVTGTTLGNYAPFCATYSFTARFNKLDISGVASYPNAYVRSLRLLYSTSTGQWGGTTPHINISYTGITYANLLTLFNDMAAQGTVTSKAINITSCTGAASLTAADRLIITSKGWTITG